MVKDVGVLVILLKNLVLKDYVILIQRALQMKIVLNFNLIVKLKVLDALAIQNLVQLILEILLLVQNLLVQMENVIMMLVIHLPVDNFNVLIIQVLQMIRNVPNF